MWGEGRGGEGGGGGHLGTNPGRLRHPAPALMTAAPRRVLVDRPEKLQKAKVMCVSGSEVHLHVETCAKFVHTASETDASAFIHYRTGNMHRTREEFLCRLPNEPTSTDK